jgi:hypothetical protein
VVDADAVAQEALKILPVGRIERGAIQRGANSRPCRLDDTSTLIRFCAWSARSLREVDQVDRRRDPLLT